MSYDDLCHSVFSRGPWECNDCKNGVRRRNKKRPQRKGKRVPLCQTVFVVLFGLCARLSLLSLIALCLTVFVVHLSQDRWPHSLCDVALWSIWSKIEMTTFSVPRSKIDDHILCAMLSLWSVCSKIDDHILYASVFVSVWVETGVFFVCAWVCFWSERVKTIICLMWTFCSGSWVSYFVFITGSE